MDCLDCQYYLDFRSYNLAMGIESRCVLPYNFLELPLRISQGNNGPWSHFLIRTELERFPGKFSERDLIYAVDFALPFGSEVRAARDGEVYGVILCSNWFYEGLDPEVGNNAPPLSTNLIILSHGDGTTTLYSHLSGEALVYSGQFVMKGEVIARTGKSGWVAEVPHLHFQVNTQTLPTKSLPVVFENYHGPLDHKMLIKERLIWFG